MTKVEKQELLIKIQEEMDALFKTLPSQFENPNVNHFKKGVFATYQIISKSLNQ